MPIITHIIPNVECTVWMNWKWYTNNYDNWFYALHCFLWNNYRSCRKRMFTVHCANWWVCIAFYNIHIAGLCTLILFNELLITCRTMLSVGGIFTANRWKWSTWGNKFTADIQIWCLIIQHWKEIGHTLTHTYIYIWVTLIFLDNIIGYNSNSCTFFSWNRLFPFLREYHERCGSCMTRVQGEYSDDMSVIGPSMLTIIASEL